MPEYVAKHKAFETRNHEYFEKILNEYIVEGWHVIACGAVHEEGQRELKWWAILHKLTFEKTEE